MAQAQGRPDAWTIEEEASVDRDGNRHGQRLIFRLPVDDATVTVNNVDEGTPAPTVVNADNLEVDENDEGAAITSVEAVDDPEGGVRSLTTSMTTASRSTVAAC